MRSPGTSECLLASLCMSPDELLPPARPLQAVGVHHRAPTRHHPAFQDGRRKLLLVAGGAVRNEGEGRRPPPGTTARCSSNAVDLRLKGGDTTLLDRARKTRGKICVDGTFWSIEGRPDEEWISRVQTYDTLTDFDWGGLYPNFDDEVTSCKYDEPEELDVRKYAKGLGVDIDNIDMSMVNETIFEAGLGGGARRPRAGTRARSAARKARDFVST
ncbi:hypothetical protein ACHAWF_006110 [Thalassiosira exigua]